MVNPTPQIVSSATEAVSAYAGRVMAENLLKLFLKLAAQLFVPIDREDPLPGSQLSGIVELFTKPSPRPLVDLVGVLAHDLQGPVRAEGIDNDDFIHLLDVF